MAKTFTEEEIQQRFARSRKKSTEAACLHINLMRASNASHLSFVKLDEICGTKTGIRKMFKNDGMLGIVLANRVARTLSFLFGEHYTIDDLISRDIAFPETTDLTVLVDAYKNLNIALHRDCMADYTMDELERFIDDPAAVRAEIAAELGGIPTEIWRRDKDLNEWLDALNIGFDEPKDFIPDIDFYLGDLELDPEPRPYENTLDEVEDLLNELERISDEYKVDEFEACLTTHLGIEK